VFAGAAREAVFSNPAIIRRVQADFIPVALKAGLVNNPGDHDEGRLYAEIGRSKPAPQGICVANSAGKVLEWALMFDEDKSVVAFLDHALKRFAAFPDARRPVAAERYMRFPSEKLEDVADSGKVLPIPDRHPEGKSCPAKPRLQQGTLVARLFGRALDKDGKPVADAVRQEHYVEDRFHVPVPMQAALARALADAGAKRFRLADDLARLLVSQAYLGQLDVNPVAAPGGRGGLADSTFHAQKVAADGKDVTQIRIEGRSKAAGASHEGEGGDGRLWQHDVTLTWEGLIEMQGARMTRLLLLARGSEKLKWANSLRPLKGEVDVTHLPAGHPIDLACNVRYGIIGMPVPADEAAPAESDALPKVIVQVPEEARRHLVEAFGPPFVVFRERVQEEVRLSAVQKEKVQQRLHATIQDAMRFFEKMNNLNPEDREQELGSYRAKAQEKLAAFIKETLNPDQRKRLRQLELQQEGTLALGRPDVADELKLTEKQHRQLEAIVLDLQKNVQPLVQQAQEGGKSEEIAHQVMKLRKEHEARIEALLAEPQKKQWRAMLGKPFTFRDGD
jgi:hypothetical protein